jgi:UDP-2,3-diacylglucosamine pyrophosphatase LpxH
MPDIRYVCLSDVHLGEEDSLLTNVDPQTGEAAPHAASPVLLQLAACFRELLKHNAADASKPTLILNGDILELALCREDLAIQAFAQFVSQLMSEEGGLFGEIVFIPGNHDHHLWEIARETQYLNYMRRLPSLEELQPAWHTTKVFMDMQGKDRLVHASLTAIARSSPFLGGLEILTAYPNFGLLSGAGERCVIFHHGHFIESAYHLMSTAASLIFSDHQLPGDVYNLEAENFAWIDCFWSTMGRSGKVGTEIDRIYEASTNKQSLRKLTDALAGNLARKYDLLVPWSDWLEEKAYQLLLRYAVVNRVAGRLERQRPDSLSEEASTGLRWYLEGPLRNQIQVEHGPAPGDVTFVFGHTHKPFEGTLDPPGVRVFNTGGWVLDTAEPRPEQGGAAVLIDEDLNAVNLRFYQEGQYRVRVEEPFRAGQRHSLLFEHVNSMVQGQADPWRSFSETAAREAGMRVENFKERVRAPAS